MFGINQEYVFFLSEIRLLLVYDFQMVQPAIAIIK